MSISKIRTILYSLAKYLGDFTAIKRAYKSKSFIPVLKRIINRVKGRLFSRFF